MKLYSEMLKKKDNLGVLSIDVDDNIKLYLK
jgi:hypothetical protein